ncbi:MAG: T9SS type A sorting domain-containing protein, partial [Bacteroidota bacterium]
ASGRVWLKSHDIEEAAEWPETDFHLQSVTQLDGNVIFSRNDRQPVYFYAAYVPVRLEKPDSDGDSLNFWFSPREALWELLPTEQATRYRAYAAQLLDQEGIDPFVHQPFEAVDAIQLDDEALERLGFRFSENSLHYTRVISAEQYIRLDLTGGTDCIAIQDLEQPTDDWDNTYVRFVSDLQGFQGLRWTLPGESPSKNSPSYLDRVQAQLVPVLIECDFLPKSYLFWFEADEQFLATIYGQEDAPFGERYATWLKTQHPGLVEGTNPIRLAPNPASGYTELRLEGVGEEPYRWQLINLQGQVIRTSDWQAFGEAARINLNGLPTGIYLVVVRLESGAQFRSQLLLEQ